MAHVDSGGFTCEDLWGGAAVFFFLVVLLSDVKMLKSDEEADFMCHLCI